MGRESVSRFFFQKLDILSTDDKWNVNFNSNKEKMQKLLNLENFSLSLMNTKDLKNAEVKNGNYFSGLNFNLESYSQINTSLQKSKIQIDFLNQEYSEKIYKKLKNKLNNIYLLQPCNLTIKLQQKFKEHVANAEKTNFDIKIDFHQPLIFIFNKNQIEYLNKIEKHLKAMEIIRNNLHIRPTTPLRTSQLDWFRYAIKAVIDQNRKLKLDIQKSTYKLFMRKRYINLYKRKQRIVRKKMNKLLAFSLANFIFNKIY